MYGALLALIMNSACNNFYIPLQQITRPDSKPDTLGLTVLDEPCAKQSDPTVLDLQLRAISKQSTDKKIAVKSLEAAEKNPKQIDSWVENIRELHRVKPPPNVHYSK